MAFSDLCSDTWMRILTTNSTFVPAINVYESNGRALTNKQNFTWDMYTLHFPDA